MVLSNLFLAGGDGSGQQSIVIDQGKIISVGGKKHAGRHTIDLAGGIVFPGFINSHDHLDFNLFPVIANKQYSNYSEWGKDIQANNKETIEPILRIPQATRVKWGMYKNLVNGFTTVVHHGKRIAIADPFVSVIQHPVSLHSLSFEKFWRWKLNNPFNFRKPVAIHIAEGTDRMARKEPQTLLKWNWLKKELVGIHAVGLDPSEAGGFRAIVWCPASNFLLLGQTAQINLLKKQTRILFGSDSTLTASWQIWNHFAQAADLLTGKELLAALTTEAAAVWGLTDRGKIQAGMRADLTILAHSAEKEGDHSLITRCEDLLMVVQEGRIRLFDESLLEKLAGSTICIPEFSRVRMGKKCKYVYGDLRRLASVTLSHNPQIKLPLDILS